MLLEQTTYWTRLEAYVPGRVTRWQLLRARAEWLWLEWRAGAVLRRERTELARLRHAAREMPEYLRRDIGLM